MSLNWREIDVVLGELNLIDAHIQQIIQPDFRSLVMELYRKEGRRTLFIGLADRATRIHETQQRFRKPKTTQRFVSLLRSRVRGGRIVSVEHVGQDRIVRLTIERAGEQTLVWIRLWGGAANVIVTDPSGTIIDCFFRRPKRKEVSGGHYFPTPKRSSKQTGTQHSVREYDRSRRFNDVIDEYYAALHERTEAHRLKTEILSVLESRESSLKARIKQLDDGLAGSDRTGDERKYGEMILSNLHRIERAADYIEVEDWENPGTTVRVPLDTTKTPQENAENYFRRASNRKNRRDELLRQQRNVESSLSETEALKQTAGDSSDLIELRRIREDLSGKAAAQRQAAAGDVPGLSFKSGGFVILVGRNSRENDALLRHHVKGNDLWMHTRDYPGGYVFIRHQSGKTPDLDVLLDAGNLAIHYSKAKNEKRADLYYTQVKHLRRAKDGPVGLVLPTQERNLLVEIDPQRLRRLLTPHGRL